MCIAYLRQHEVDGNAARHGHRHKHHVVLPADGRERGGGGVGVRQRGAEEADVVERGALAAQVRGPDLGAVHVARALDRRREPHAEDEVHGDGGVEARREGRGQVVLLQDALDDEQDDAAEAADDQHVDAAEPVHQKHVDEAADQDARVPGDAEAELHHGVEAEVAHEGAAGIVSVGVRQGGREGGRRNSRDQVGDDGDAGALAHRPHEQRAHSALEHARRREDVPVAAGQRALRRNLRADLHELGLGHGALRVADVAVQALEDAARLVFAALLDQPARGFGQEEERAEEDAGEAGEDDEVEAPGVVLWWGVSNGDDDWLDGERGVQH